MSLGTSNRDGGKTSESGHLRALAKLVNGDVLEGLNAVQRAAGVNMSVDVQVGDAFVRRSDGSYAHPVFNDAVYNQVISAADGSNPRRDIVVIYVDYGQTPSTAVSNNTNGVVKIKVVNGTPAGSPVDPNDAAIQSSVGAGNPWTKIARVRVPAGQTSISNSLIDDLRSLIKMKTNSVPRAALEALAVDTSKIDFASMISGNKINLGSLKLQWGWNFVTGTGGVSAHKTITFAEAYTVAPYVLVSMIGYKVGSDPTSPSDVGAEASWTVGGKSVTTTNFQAFYSQASGTLASNIRIAYFWFAIGA